MSGIKYFPKDLNIEGKKIVLRVDFNVPVKEKKIQDYTRILQVLPFLKKLINKKSKIIIVSHLGRPKEGRENDLSLIPIYKFLKEKLETNIYFYTGEINDELKNKVSFLKSGEVIMIEKHKIF